MALRRSNRLAQQATFRFRVDHMVPAQVVFLYWAKPFFGPCGAQDYFGPARGGEVRRHMLRFRVHGLHSSLGPEWTEFLYRASFSSVYNQLITPLRTNFFFCENAPQD
jgi:hypothetical protein